MKTNKTTSTLQKIEDKKIKKLRKTKEFKAIEERANEFIDYLCADYLNMNLCDVKKVVLELIEHKLLDLLDNESIALTEKGFNGDTVFFETFMRVFFEKMDNAKIILEAKDNSLRG